jgi:hypothetical protein
VAIQTSDPQIEIMELKFAGHVQDGYRFFDHAGSFIARVRNEQLEWNTVRGLPNQAVFKHYKDPLVADIGSQAVVLSHNAPVRLEVAVEAVEKLAKAAEYFYTLYTETIKSPRTLRVGVHFAFAFPAGNVEEADRFVTKSIASPFSEILRGSTKGDFYDGSGSYFLTDPQGPVRRSFHVSSVVRDALPGVEPPMGFPVSGNGAVVVAVDNFTRPDEGHFPKLAMFIQEQYVISKTYALEAVKRRVG